ncbi:MAG: GNAT family N-acetyltransferase [Desulfobacterales bacterium]|nr:GNAT family N-acetyltransferase [Desulfobacterales bacterium]
MIRKAEGKDKSDISKLHYLAAPHIFSYFFASPETIVLKILDRLFETPDTIFSKDFFWVNEDHGTIRGAISIFPGRNKKLFEKNIGKYGKEFAQIAGFFPAIKMMFRGSLNKYIPSIYDDELYIQAIAVFPKYRGQRIASALLHHAFEYANQQQLPKVSLLIEIPNEHAILVYEQYGFLITMTQQFKRKYRKHKLLGVHKMVAEVRRN